MRVELNKTLMELVGERGRRGTPLHMAVLSPVSRRAAFKLALVPFSLLLELAGKPDSACQPESDCNPS